MLFELIRRQEAQLVSGIDAESSWFKFVKEGFQPSGINISTNIKATDTNGNVR